MLCIPAMVLLANVSQQLESFNAPGYSIPVSGVWYTGAAASSAMPLGALGAGFVDLTAGATFGESTAQNNWLKPRQVPPKCGLTIALGDKRLDLFPGMKTPENLRFWGHYPLADVDFGGSFGGDVVYMRAFAPFVPHDYELSGLPAALFKFVIINRSSSAKAVEIGLQWQAADATPTESQRKPVVLSGPSSIEVKVPNGSYAVGAMGDPKWSFKHQELDSDVIRTQAVRTLGPSETAEVTLGLAWNFPSWMSSDGEQLRHRYAIKHVDAASVLAAVLPRSAEIEKRIITWQDLIYLSPSTPPLLKDAVINGLYVMARNSWWIDDGRFFQSESFTGCPITETFVGRFNGSFPLALMFPECERATMRSVAAAQAPSGEIPFGFGSPMGSRSPYYHVQHPIVSPEFVLLTWRNYILWNDGKYLDEMYPYCQAALRFAMTLDKDKDGVVNEDPGSDSGFPANQYYDIWPWWGTSAYTGSIWLAALRAGEEMAKKKSDTAFAEEMRKWYRAASASFYEKLWTGSFYRLYNDPEHNRMSDTCLTNGLCGQWFAYVTGLGEIVPRATILSTVDTVFRRNVPATKFGAVNGVCPDGRPDETFPDHSAVITIGEVWNFCAMAAAAGRKEDAMRLFTDSYANILLRQRTPWNIPWSLDRNTGAIKWGINYYSNPCVWTLFQVLDPDTYAKLAVPPA